MRRHPSPRRWPWVAGLLLVIGVAIALPWWRNSAPSTPPGEPLTAATAAPVTLAAAPAAPTTPAGSAPANTSAEPTTATTAGDASSDQFSITFYNQLANRKIVLPAAEESDPSLATLMKLAKIPEEKPDPAKHGAAPSPATTKAAATTTRAQREITPSNSLQSATPTAMATSPDTTGSGGRYAVQSVSYSSFDRAANLASAIQRQGMAATVVRIFQNGAEMFRVRMGPFGSRELAARAAGKLTGGGHTIELVARQ